MKQVNANSSRFDTSFVNDQSENPGQNVAAHAVLFGVVNSDCQSEGLCLSSVSHGGIRKPAAEEDYRRTCYDELVSVLNSGLPMSIEELLEQMEQYRQRREQRDFRPEWLKQLIREVAAIFEPLTNVGRVGYDCQLDERGWTLCLYLGTTEIVGGPKDGQIDHASFRIDLCGVTKLFSRVDRFEWYSVADESRRADADRHRSLITVHGAYREHHEIRLELLGTPPNFSGPGLHCRPDGTIYETQ